MDNLPGINVYLDDFYLRLKSAEFAPINDDRAYWSGILHVEWQDSKSGEYLSADHHIGIFLPSGFPYHAPVVLSLDNPKLEKSLHLSNLNTLCLWREPNGWNPFTSALKLLKRINKWFIHYHQSDWPEDFAPTDLHLYLDQEKGMVVIGDEWIPDPNQSFGSFVLWRDKKSLFWPSLVGLRTNTEQYPIPEKKLVTSLSWNHENSISHNGVWFHVHNSFVPANYLDALLEQIERYGDYPKGEVLSILTKFLTREIASNGIPIAIGYPAVNGKENWLFLWVVRPKNQKLKLSNSLQRRSVAIHSFECASAQKDALVRRTIHTSKKLSAKKVVLFGVGSLGGSIAILLGKAGMGEIVLVDSDSIRPANAVRHQTGINYSGLKKTLTVKWQIERHNPDCLVTCLDEEWDKNKILDIIKEADLVIDATANVSFSLWLNQIVVESSIPILFATTYRRAAIGRLIWRRQSIDPCLGCYFLVEKQWDEEQFPVIRPDPTTVFGEDGCASVTEEADAINIESVACITAKAILRYFSKEELKDNLLLLVNDPIFDGHTILSQEGLHSFTNKAIRECPICGFISRD